MPTIQTTVEDLADLFGAPVDRETLDRDLVYVKGELKSWGETRDAEAGGTPVKIELNDTNRPDTWTPEGIVRQLRLSRGEGAPAYRFLEEPAGADLVVEVDADLEGIRPWITAFVAEGPAVTDATLRSLIQTQEKLSETFGRRRKDIAAGIYKLDLVRFPVRYTTIGPDDDGFVPLGETRRLSPRAILAEHPKGREYAATLAGKHRYPLLRGQDGNVLSMPPIINSNDVGAVAVGDSRLFVEFTGTDLGTLTTATNIMACDMADRGFRIRRAEVRYPYDTPAGRKVVSPRRHGSRMEVATDLVQRALGIELPAEEIVSLLTRFGLTVEALPSDQGGAGLLAVLPPAYRNDLLHAMDVVEDVAIQRGYDSFPRVMPQEYTVGRLTPLQKAADRLRERMVGFGYQEMSLPVLTRRELQVDRLGGDGSDLVEIANPMSENFSVVRSSLLPGLLEVEATSYRAGYPHRIFECGEVAVQAPGTLMGTATRRRLAVLSAHAEASFAEGHAVLSTLLAGLGGLTCRLEARKVPGLMAGRSGAVLVAGTEGEREIGVLGELDPAVLAAWNVKVPCVAFELDVAVLSGIEAAD